jgi:hypothetical protein
LAGGDEQVRTPLSSASTLFSLVRVQEGTAGCPPPRRGRFISLTELPLNVKEEVEEESAKKKPETLAMKPCVSDDEVEATELSESFLDDGNVSKHTSTWWIPTEALTCGPPLL